MLPGNRITLLLVQKDMLLMAHIHTLKLQQQCAYYYLF